MACISSTIIPIFYCYGRNYFKISAAKHFTPYIRIAGRAQLGSSSVSHAALTTASASRMASALHVWHRGQDGACARKECQLSARRSAQVADQTRQRVVSPLAWASQSCDMFPRQERELSRAKAVMRQPQKLYSVTSDTFSWSTKSLRPAHNLKEAIKSPPFNGRVTKNAQPSLTYHKNSTTGAFITFRSKSSLHFCENIECAWKRDIELLRNYCTNVVELKEQHYFNLSTTPRKASKNKASGFPSPRGCTYKPTTQGQHSLNRSEDAKSIPGISFLNHLK